MLRPPVLHRLLAPVLVAVLVALCSGATVVASARPAAADDGSCTDGDGVTVVIDFQELGGGIYVRCATDRPSNGFEALRQAGISFQTAVRSPGFLCRIAGKPASDPCVVPSPATAYWAYWMAPRGGPWCYSNFGAGNRTPVPGTVEGWSFSSNKTAAQTPTPGYLPAPLATGPNPQIPAKDCTVPKEGATTTTAPNATTAPTSPTTRPTTPTTRPTGSGSGSGSGSGTGSGGTGSGSGSGSGGTGSGSTNSGGGTNSGGSSGGETNGTGTGSGATTSTTGRSGATTTSGSSSTSTTTASGASSGGAGTSTTAADGKGRSGGSDEVASKELNRGGVDLSNGGSNAKGSPVPLIVAGLLIAGLAGCGYVAIRRNRAATAPLP